MIDRFLQAAIEEARAGLAEGGIPIGSVLVHRVARYRCLSCHQIGDRGADISTAPLTFEGSKVNREWLIEYLLLPYPRAVTSARRSPTPPDGSSRAGS